ncbi:MAG TPA: InlB B-repeat-containing protein [Thermotogota bacterium]|nr:InlB B-repeat-containing protein [Thermotogota bacterium]HOM54954.1 InlB B-repeat-containing protein [Thermotogota bacterium]HOS24311.1 InlB B-repeat-containing protein [Thermotogota bacterium]HOT86648.1 InlB B-repeat-containing protein [Thermotogota bacterium]HPD36346.1 InlB B-repeat-containing protein [Thermotogota bacterium]
MKKSRRGQKVLFLIVFVFMPLTVFITGCDGGAVPPIHNDDLTILAQAVPAEGGDVRINGGAWGDSKNVTVTNGTQVTLEARTSNGYTFDGWYDGSVKVSSNTTYQFIAAANKTYKANFSQNVTQCTITAQASPAEGGDVRINGGAWGDNKIVTVNSGTQVTLEAAKNEGYTFAGWYEGMTKVSGANPYAFNANANRTLRAFFVTKAPDPSLRTRVEPEDLVYIGAFLTPEPLPWAPDAETWEWGGMGMTYNPNGDAESPSDGFPGSIFGAGHDVWNLISEFDIPTPVLSRRKNINDLPLSRFLQPFTDIRGNLFPWVEEMPRMDIELFPSGPSRTPGQLVACWGVHLQDEHEYPTHMVFNSDLNNPNPQGPWFVEGLNPYNGNDYLFSIPEDWADEYVQGLRFATGRYRDGGWSGFGPTIAAINPWRNGNLPLARTVLPSVILLKYSDYYEGEPDPWHEMDGYAHSDEWSGGVWVRAGSKEAVVFVGTKGIGNTWYGNPDGPCMDCENRGWWSDAFEGWFLFYDPADLAKVAQGTLQPWEPQPYAHLNIDEHLFYITSTQQKYHVGACCYDSENHLLYVFESGRGEEERTLVHVWRVQTE